MRIKCPYCKYLVEFQGDVAGKTVECPNCKERYQVNAPEPRTESKPDRAIATLNAKVLRDPKEMEAFAWLVFFSLGAWFFLAAWIVGTLGIGLIFIGLILLARYMVELFLAAYIKTNGVEVSSRQFPEIYAIAADFSHRLGKPVPAIYVLQQNMWNAWALKAGGTRMVVLLSGAVDSILLKGNTTQLAWVVGHELGHHFAGHLNFWRQTTAQLGSWFFWIGLWYQRRCELTCDRYGLACVNNYTESQRALCNMAVGAHLAAQVDVNVAIAQWSCHREEFFVKLRTLYSTHPQVLCRMEALARSAVQLGILGDMGETAGNFAKWIIGSRADWLE